MRHAFFHQSPVGFRLFFHDGFHGLLYRVFGNIAHFFFRVGAVLASSQDDGRHQEEKEFDFIHFFIVFLFFPCKFFTMPTGAGGFTGLYAPHRHLFLRAYILLIPACRVVRLGHAELPCGYQRVDVSVLEAFSVF